MSKLNYGPFVPSRIKEWAYWITERESIRHKKEVLGLPPPWTDDFVMADTRWCNVRRMDDKVSRWMLTNWYRDFHRSRDYVDHKHVVGAALLARMINRVETLTHISGGTGRYVPFDYNLYLERMYQLKDKKQPVFTGAYIINGASGGPKIEQVLGAVRQFYETAGLHAAKYLRTDSMQITADNLAALRGVGSFISGQVVADLRWLLGSVVPDEHGQGGGSWADRMRWAPVGPGSSRGMRYLLGLYSPADMAGRGSDMNQAEFTKYIGMLIELAKRHPTVGPIFDERGLEAHDTQNTLCETSKLIRIKYGMGKAKNRYQNGALS